MTNVQTHTFNVEMTCSGCSGAVTRILNKKLGEGDNFNVDLEKRSVEITSKLSADELTEILQKCGKSVTYIGTK